MKSKTSLFNKAVLKRNLSGCWALLAGLTVIYVLLLAFNAYVQLNDMDRSASDIAVRSAQIMMDVIRHMGFFVTIAAAAAVITAMAVFSYLFTARNSNMMHTFPVNRSSLFVTNYVSGVLILMVPAAAGMLSALAAGAAMGAVNIEVMKNYVIWLGIVFSENLFFFSMSVCVVMFVGNIVAVPVLYFILNFLYKGCVLIAESMVEVVCYGMSGYHMDTIGVLTPVRFMLQGIGFQNKGGMDEADICYSLLGGKELAGYLLAAVLLTVCAWTAYRKKQIETAGDVITVGWLKPVFRWGIAVCTSSVGVLFICGMTYMGAISFPAVLITAAVCGVIFFFAAQMLLERSIHVFKKKRIRECIIYTVIICACYIGLDADVLGMEKKIPDAAQIQKIWLSNAGNIYAEDEETIARVLDIHKQLIQAKKELEAVKNRQSEHDSLNIVYTLKDGSSLQRHYDFIPYNKEPASLYGQIHSLINDPDILLKSFFGVHYPNITVFGGQIGELVSGDAEQYGIRLTEAEAKKIYEAAVQDILAGHFNYSDMDETISYVGNLLLDVRDEEGFRNKDYHGEDYKEGIAEIWVYDNNTYLIQALQELEYLKSEPGREK